MPRRADGRENMKALGKSICRKGKRRNIIKKIENWATDLQHSIFGGRTGQIKGESKVKAGALILKVGRRIEKGKKAGFGDGDGNTPQGHSTSDGDRGGTLKMHRELTQSRSIPGRIRFWG